VPQLGSAGLEVGDSPQQGGRGMPHGPALAAQGTGKGRLPAWHRAGTGHSPGCRLALQRALRSPPKGKEQPRGAKTSPGCTVGAWGGQDLPLKEGKWCSGAPTTLSPPVPLPRGDGAAPRAPPFAAPCRGPGPSLLRHPRGQVPRLGRTPQRCRPRGCSAPARRPDAPDALQLDGARAMYEKVFEKRVTAPQTTGRRWLQARTRTAESVS